MRSEKSVHNYLEARDRRQDTLDKLLSNGYPVVLSFTLNIPGSRKTPPGVFGLYNRGLSELYNIFPKIRILVQGSDLLGPYTFFMLEADPVEVKKQCVVLESGEPSARLIDLDVYDSQGHQLDRASLGLPARTCLVCHHPAVECIRLKRHSLEEVIAKTDELLAQFTY
jgi:holo-ACP synthase CitX